MEEVKSDAGILRQKAENRLKSNPLKSGLPLSEAEMLRLIHELEVHQIELEIQNEELIEAKNRISELALKSLKDSEENHNALIFGAMDGFCLFDRRGFVQEVNDIFCFLIGYSRQELLTMHVSDFVNIESKTDTINHIQRIEEQGYDRFETQHRCKNGSILDVEISIVFKTSNGGQFVTFIHDISKRKRREAELRQSEKRYKSLFHDNYSVMLLVNPETGDIIDANPAACNYYGWSHTELSSRNISDLNMLSMEAIIAEMAQARKEQRNHFYFRHRLSTGEIRDVEVYSGPIQFAETTMLYSIVHDITDRNKAEEALRDSERKMDAVFNSVTETILLLDIEGKILAANETAANRWGISAEDLTGRSVYSFLTAEAQRRMPFQIQELIETGLPIHFEDKRGNRNYDLTFYPIKQTSGKINQFVVFNRDITEFKRIDESLKESEKKYRELVKHAPTGIYEIDFKTQRFTSVNDVMVRITGYSSEELLSMNVAQLLDDESKQAFNSRLEGYLKGEMPVENIEYKIKAKDGHLIYAVLDVKYKVNDQGMPTGATVIGHDISERVLMESALRESEFFFRESQQAGFIGSYKINFKTRLWESSDVLYQIFGIDKNDIQRIESWFSLVYPDDRPMLYQHLTKEVIKKGLPFNKEFRIIRNDNGEIRWVLGLGSVRLDGNKNTELLVGTIQDITQRKVKEEKLRKLNKTLAALSKSSLAMSQAVDEAAYLNQVCRIVVEDIGFAMVWIGFAEQDKAKTIRPIASAGYMVDYLQAIKITWDDSAWGKGPTGTAIRTGNICTCNNMHTDPAFEPWREQALKRGYASSIVFPLKTGNKPFGAITIYSSETNSFLQDEIKQLSELANDLSHGITTIRLRAAHQLAEEALSKSHNELEMQVKERTAELLITNDLLKKEINIGKNHEQSLKLAEEKYRTVADHTHGWEFWLDKDDQFLYCSPSCERITGYKAAEFLRNPELLFDIVHPVDKKKYQYHKKREDLCQVRDSELEYRIIRNDGSIRWIGHECQPITDEVGNFIGVRGSNKDITGRKQIEQLLKISSRKYRLLSANINDGIFICKSGCLEYVNKAMKRIFGYSHYKMEGLMLTQLVMPEYYEELNAIFTINSSVNHHRTIEIECLKKDHSTIHVEILFNYVAKEKVIYGVVHDISDKKQLQKNIVKAIILTEEKERAHFSKELHDGLGPLLSTIKLYLQCSERPKAHTSRKQIIHQAEDVLEEALTTVKEISNKLSPHLLINYGLTSAIQSFVNKLDETSVLKIDFKTNVNRRLGNEIEAALYRAVIECINNTIKHAKASAISITLNDDGNQLHLEYNDDGIGFDLDEKLSRNKGLGLFNLQNRIENIGGKILLFSSPGRGVNYQINVNI